MHDLLNYQGSLMRVRYKDMLNYQGSLMRVRYKDMVHHAVHALFSSASILCSGQLVSEKRRVRDDIAIDCMTCLIIKAREG